VLRELSRQTPSPPEIEKIMNDLLDRDDLNIAITAVSIVEVHLEKLIVSRSGFGIEKHDDAVDALVYLILGLVGDGIEQQKVHYV
jgi:hypothetical protein